MAWSRADQLSVLVSHLVVGYIKNSALNVNGKKKNNEISPLFITECKRFRHLWQPGPTRHWVAASFLLLLAIGCLLGLTSWPHPLALFYSSCALMARIKTCIFHFGIMKYWHTYATFCSPMQMWVSWQGRRGGARVEEEVVVGRWFQSWVARGWCRSVPVHHLMVYLPPN